MNGTNLAAEVARLQARVDELEAGGERPALSSRRRVLRLAGAAAAGGAVALLGRPGSAEATTGTMMFGSTNDAGTSETTLSASGTSSALRVTNSNVNGTGVRGTGVSDGTGVYGVITSPTTYAYGVWGRSVGASGYGVVAEGGTAQMRLATGNQATMPNAGGHETGELAYANDNGLYLCVASGTPGTWRTLAHANAAGSYFPVTPTRVYDSRTMVPSTKLTPSTTRTVSVADGVDSYGMLITPNLVPVGATAVFFNLTIVGTTGAGNLVVNPGGVATAGASTINWNTTGAVLANAATVRVNASRQVTVVCSGGAGASTHFLLDIVGYYR
ncbi:MAG: hypothetical protein Q7V88_16880 [Actinomycetota bacterium]|nr:hypothetical protein [Actinomycetota bacterium]